MTAQPGGTFRCLLVTAETEQEGMLLALTENTLYAGRAQNVPGMELQGIPVERIALEEPKAYQEHAVFFHRARGLDDITGRDVHRPMPERQTSFRGGTGRCAERYAVPAVQRVRPYGRPAVFV